MKIDNSAAAALHAPMTPVLEAILGTLPVPEGLLTDVGCGAGHKTALIRSTLNFAGPIVGIDCDRKALSAAARGGMWAIAGDAHMLPLRTACCDAAVCLATLGMLHDQRAALCELRRVVRLGGWLVIVTATTAWTFWSVRLRDWIQTVIAERERRGVDLLLTTPEPAADLAALLRDAGWREVRAGAFVIETGNEMSQRVLPLISQNDTRQLTQAEVREYDALVADADVELLPLMLVATGR
ncbi:MAG: class I SAM-dependent methyltransferase [Roseiflexus sp.]|jgi:ubiquinone/menaquinone biosynthesis C-methylase UbiE|nr:class I SAM-dependent methyltransferase [Roseiflexus sp.]MBO9333502.1 class I SAM-dependent methyltransferase [Roseiflexus sp.]MBO9383381.1 class I SAM-dependent methyltransferase [Roseiflexus sp.]MBO9389110.1 class I SAM-dependent methyltransferase [Roseiflexus sp.]